MSIPRGQVARLMLKWALLTFLFGVFPSAGYGGHTDKNLTSRTNSLRILGLSGADNDG